MLAKSQRLNLTKDFKWVSSGKRLETPHFIISTKMGENKIAKVGIALSAKNFKKAHERNRAKRLTSQAMQQLYPLLPKGTNLVIMPKANTLLSSALELFEEIRAILPKIS